MKSLWLISCCVLLSSLSVADSTCLFYDNCDPSGFGQKPCLANESFTEPHPIDNDAMYQSLISVCVDYIGHRNDSVCCAPGQVAALSKQLTMLKLVVGNCPSCFYNLARLFCHLTCAPNQSEFMRVTKTSKSSTKNVSQADAIDYVVDEQSVVTAYDSCKDVTSGTTGLPAIAVVCGTFGVRCNPELLLTALGTSPPSPMNINFTHVADSPDMEPLVFNSTSCRDAPSDTEHACSCTDCPIVCPILPLPAKAEEFCVVGMDGFYFLCMVLFSVFLVAFVVAHFIRARRMSEEEDLTTLIESRTSTTSSKNEEVSRSKMNEIFEKWGIFCAKHPYSVIFCSIAVVAACTSGLSMFQIMNDPVELWSGPTSRARLERDYFNKHLAPFYRVSQVIIKQKNPEFFVYKSNFTSEETVFSGLYKKEFLKKVLKLQQNIASLVGMNGNKTVELDDICFKPMDQACTIQTAWNWFQNNLTTFEQWSDQYLDHMLTCMSNPTSISDVVTNAPPTGCLGDYGGPVFPYVAMGGYNNTNYTSAPAIILTFLINNHVNASDQADAIAWEREYIEFMKNFTRDHAADLGMDIGFNAEISVMDELSRESSSDIVTIGVSYVLMFVYVSIALGRYKSFKDIFLHSQITLGLSGVVIVLLSVSSSMGLYSYFGVPATLIIFEVIPFLVLAVGVDNIFILVQSHQRTARLDGESIEEHIGRVFGAVGPSMLLASLSESTCFFLGALTDMPAVKVFALYAGMAIVFDFLLQITAFVALISIDANRIENKRYDVLCCIKSSDEEDYEFSPSMLYTFVKEKYSPMLKKRWYRYSVLIIFVGWAFFSASVAHNIDVGLDQEISMPTDSYLQTYFLYLKNYLSVGAPVFFVVKGGFNYSSFDNQNLIGSFPEAYPDSLLNRIHQAARKANETLIAAPPQVWLDDYKAWLGTCCHEFDNQTYCTHPDNYCKQCDKLAEPFLRHVSDFLNEKPGPSCPVAGKAAYSNSIEVLERNEEIGATDFMSYHSVLKTSPDYVDAIRLARYIANLTQNMIRENYTGDASQVEVFPYSIFYVFYEQYLTVWQDLLYSMAYCILGIGAITFVMFGFKVFATVVIMSNLCMIMVDLMGVMYLFNISLNAVSAVNLVVSLGISVEFCSHIVKSFYHAPYALDSPTQSIDRAMYSLSETGASVFSGITLTKFAGVAVLAFAKSQLFVVFYFRMYLAIVLIGAAHGLIFLPVVLAMFGPHIAAKR